ncbi:hypothetical protein CHGG_01056 [Chaetomium globosum CBS 148.51]|uniref:Meiotically up-regulated protein Msb1/Mug8 domain-containing protein n=1 Tax=Chaetomium globosum (strain ATCC 6205 / CBS 148.51 / DSM 1962 / NBRC 6347 / NRRL 1970) TaxID=306901 RepID=Q2HFE8_CHAGB|nr:uncharacterized protein CHGG_01056 [Chaetomium globosum CBS 148.51]EAQ92821.1 hypothetical protein CHGG_01056 [Chaetomium globosum CBS 148.51]
MPSLFSRLKGKDGKSKSKKGALDQPEQPLKPRWDDAWARKTIDPEEVQQLLRFCTEELKARALDLPFLLLPFRPTSDPSAVRTFVRHFFDGKDGGQLLRGEALARELRMTEPMVGYCDNFTRVVGGRVANIGDRSFRAWLSGAGADSRAALLGGTPTSFSRSESMIIFDFFDLLAAIAAHSKSNGFGGRKLSRMAAWWAFEPNDNGNGFEGGAADATSHLFFAYMRSLAPEPVQGGISLLPMSLQKLLQETEYPPQRPALMQTSTNRVAMIVDTVSPTPFTLLRRANHFQYRDEDRALQEWSEYEDPIQALTEECRRVLRAIAAANQSQAVSSSKHSTSLRDASWSRFEDIGFASALEEDDMDDDALAKRRMQQGLRNTPASGNGDLGRPTTPSWADFLSSGFVDERGAPNMLLPPDKVLPPIDTGTARQRSSQSHKPRLETDNQFEPGELASIVRFDLDDAFWWVWMSSLAPEETAERKSAFGRCAVIETLIRTGRWLVMEEIVKGAAPDPEEGAYIAEKKGFFSWTRRGKGLNRRKSTGKHALDKDGQLKSGSAIGLSKTSIGPDQQARIQAAALQLQRQEQQKTQQQVQERRGRKDTDYLAEKTNSVFTLQPSILSGGVSGGENEHRPGTAPERHLSSPARPDPIVTTGSSSVPRRNETPTPQTPKREDKELEVPKEIHPAERVHSPVSPPKEQASLELAREQMVSPEPALGDDSQKHKKLHKDAVKPGAGGGLKKLFSRKNRSSKLPENAAEQLKAFTAATEASAPPAVPQKAAERAAPKEQPAVLQKSQPVPARVPVPAQSPVSPVSPVSPPPAPQAPVQTAPEEPAPISDSPLPQEVSPVSPVDVTAGKEEVSRFNQGPLLDQPAFVPDDNDEDDAIPPPIARHSPRNPSPVPQQPEEEEAAPPPAPVARAVDPQDRWAQIRKNAAERAAYRQATQTARVSGGLTDVSDSSEESIETRVARIKARVAELAKAAEGGPNARVPPPIRR